MEITMDIPLASMNNEKQVVWRSDLTNLLKILDWRLKICKFQSDQIHVSMAPNYAALILVWCFQVSLSQCRDCPNLWTAWVQAQSMLALLGINIMTPVQIPDTGNWRGFLIQSRTIPKANPQLGKTLKTFKQRRKTAVLCVLINNTWTLLHNLKPDPAT